MSNLKIKDKTYYTRTSSPREMSFCIFPERLTPPGPSVLSRNLIPLFIARLCPLPIHVSPVLDSFGINLLELPKTNVCILLRMLGSRALGVRMDQVWVPLPCTGSCVGVVCVGVVCCCAHHRGSPLEMGVSPTHCTHFLFSLD